MGPTTITREIDLDASADALWDTVSDPEHMATWLGDSVDIDVRPGGTGVVVDDGVVRHVVIDHVRESRRELSFTWWEPDDPSTASRVVFAVGTTVDGRSRLTITETLQASSPGPVARASAGTLRWEVRAVALWACTVAAALVR